MSCKTQLLRATYYWTNILNNGNGQINVILLDFSKAFDVVPHHRLLMKLCMYGITYRTHRSIKDFLGNRIQDAVVNGSRSKCRMVKSVVPQVTVLGPLHSTSLFILMTLNLKSTVLFTFLLMIVPLTDQYILKMIPFLYKKIYSSLRSGQMHSKWNLMLTNVRYSVSLAVSQVQINT